MRAPYLPPYNRIEFSIGNTDFQVLLPPNLYLEPRNWNIYQHFHLFCECHFLKQGKAKLTTESDSSVLEPGHFCVIPSRLRHGIETLEEPTRKISFYVTLSQNKNDTNNTYTWYKQVFASDKLFTTSKLTPYFETLYELAPHIAITDFISRTKMECLFTMAFLDLLEKTEEVTLLEESDTKIEYEDELMLKIEAFMIEHFSPNAQPEDLAQYLCLSQRQTERLLKRLFNKTFMEIKTETRIEKAKDMIACHILSLKEIAEELGYSSYNSFYKNFKQSTGLSPDEYRDSL